MIENKKQEVITLIGLPASGKTTFAKQWVEEDPTRRVRISRDDLRHMAGVYWVPQREKLITEWEENTFIEAFDQGYSIIIDATNLRNPSRFENLMFARLMYDPRAHKVSHNFKYLFTPLEECIRRDNEREQGKVGEEVIRGMYNKYIRYNSNIPIGEGNES